MSDGPDSASAVEAAPLIVGVDGSERSHDALALAVQLAEPGQRLVLAHVHPYGELSDLLSGEDYERLVREVAESTLSAAQATLPPATERGMRLVSNRSPAAGLHGLAGDVGAALIAVGSSHRSGLGRVFAGSVAESVLAGAPVPVAVAPRGLAGSEDSIRIVGCGFRRLTRGPRGARLGRRHGWPQARAPRGARCAHSHGVRRRVERRGVRLSVGRRHVASDVREAYARRDRLARARR